MNWVTRPYRDQELEAINLRNSNRAEQLLRAGKIYLSLQDAISLALENNLDIEIQRYTPRDFEAQLLRSKAGGLIRGQTTNISQGAQSAVNFITGTGGGAGGGGTGGAGGGSGGSGGASGAQSGTVIQVTGVQIPSLDPTVSFSFTKQELHRPQTNTLVTGGVTSLVSESNIFSGSYQQNFLTGTGLTFGWQQSSNSTNSRTSALVPFNQGNFNLQLTQRMLQGFGIGVNNRNIRISKNNLKVGDITFKLQVIEITRSVINLYLDLVSFNETVKVRQRAVELAQRLYDDNKKQVEIGTLAPIEVVRAEAQLAQAQTDLIVAETQVLNQETIMKNALSRTGLDSPTWQDARIIPTDTLPPPSGDTPAPADRLMQAALEKRPEIEQTRLQVANTKIGLNGAKSQLLPSLDLFASMTNNGLAGTANPNLDPQLGRPAPETFIGGLGLMYSEMFRRHFPDYAVGFQLNVPLRNRAAQADITTDTINLRRQELQAQRQINAIKVEVSQAAINLSQARASYQSAVKARQLQEQTLDAEQKKFALGSSTIFVVVQTQRDLTQAQANEVSAITSYNKAKNSLDFAVGQLLEVHQVDIVEAMKGEVSKPPGKIPVQ